MLKLTSSPGSDSWVEWPVTDYPTTIQFYENGKYEFSSAGVKSSATYKLDGSKVTITDKKGKKIFEISKISEDKNRIQVDVYSDDGKTVTDIYDYHRCPATEDEAKEMLVGMWMADMDYSTMGSSFDLILRVFEKDGKMKYVYHVRNDLESSSSLYKYKGKYIFFPQEVQSYLLNSKTDNPSSGNIRHWSENVIDQSTPYTALTSYSIYLGTAKTKYQRITAPLTYEEYVN